MLNLCQEEIRADIKSALSAADILTGKTKPDHDPRKILKAINDEAERMKTTIVRLLS